MNTSIKKVEVVLDDVELYVILTALRSCTAKSLETRNPFLESIDKSKAQEIIEGLEGFYR